jgi:hypothetical protein
MGARAVTSSDDKVAASGHKGQSVPVAEKPPYRAYERSQEERRYLEIRLGFPESVESYSNATLSSIRTDWRMGGFFITLEYGESREGILRIITIEGDNLFEVYRAIKEWKVEWIAEFDPEDYAPVPNRAAPFIKRITIHKTRPETPPPVDKRH